MRISDWSSDVCSSDLVSGVSIIEATIGEAQDGMRLDKALAELVPDLSRERLKALIAEGQVTGRPAHARSEERRVGKECVSTCSSRWSPSHLNKNQNATPNPLSLTPLHQYNK